MSDAPEPIVIVFPKWFWTAFDVFALVAMAGAYWFLCWYCRWYERRHGRSGR